MGAKTPKPGPAEKAQTEIARRQQARTEFLQSTYEDPLRGQMQPMIHEALGTNPFRTQLSAADRAPIEGQYNQAKAALMNTATRGGQLRRQMTGLERDRASAISQAQNQAKQLGQARALQYGATALPNVGSIAGMSGQAQQGMNALTGLESMRRQQGQAQATSNSEMAMKGLGTLASLYMGGATNGMTGTTATGGGGGMGS